MITNIQLVNQGNNSSNGTTVCSLTMSGCKKGNMLILAYAVRGDGNIITLTEGWNFIGGGNNRDTSDGGLSQRIYFVFKFVDSETETVTITQTDTSRIYMVCSEYSGVAGFKMRDDMAAIGTGNYTVATAKSEPDEIILYAVTSAYYGSGRLQTATPSDLVKIEGDSNAERLACWFDCGTGSLEHTFQTYNVVEPRIAIVECVQLIPLISKYLIKNYTADGYELLTVDAEGTLQPIPTLEIVAETFRTHGFDEAPASDLLVTLSKFDVLRWYNSTEFLPTLSAEITATPPPQTVVTNLIDMTDETILGVESITVTATGSPLFALSFDGKQTWEGWTGSAWATLDTDISGMTAEIMQNIAVDQWAAKVAGLTGFYLKFVLHDGDVVQSIVVDFLN